MIKRIAGLALINLIPVALLFVLVMEVHDVLDNSHGYPFESDCFFPYSIYTSKTIYVAYNMAFGLSLVALIIASIFRKYTLYVILLFINIFLFFLPVFTNSN